MSLPNSEAGKLAISLIVLAGYLVDTLCLKPVFGPLEQVKWFSWSRVVVAFLQRANKIVQAGVAPGVATEIDVKAFAEGFPSNEEDQLFDYARTFSICDTIDESIGHTSCCTLDLYGMV